MTRNQQRRMAFGHVRRTQTHETEPRNASRGQPGIKDERLERGGERGRWREGRGKGAGLKSQGWRAVKASLMRPIPPDTTRFVRVHHYGLSSQRGNLGYMYTRIHKQHAYTRQWESACRLKLRWKGSALSDDSNDYVAVKGRQSNFERTRVS